MRFVLRNGNVIDPSYGSIYADVVIEQGKISTVGFNAAAAVDPSDRDTCVVDCTDRWVVPGLVDVHTHLREPGQEYKEDIESGTRAAAVGGFTRVCAMPNTVPANDDPTIADLILSGGRERGCVRVHSIGAITRGLQGQELSSMRKLLDRGCVAFSDDGRCVTDPVIMRAALMCARELGVPLIQHAEDHAMTAGALMHEGTVSRQLGRKGWPREAEDSIVARDLRLVEEIGARYHVAHASTRGTVALLREAKDRGLPVTAEVTPHHLTLTDEAVVYYNTACKVNPPLREREDIEALVDGLADGTIDCVATDHAPHAAHEKAKPFSDAPNGMIGLETALPLLLDWVHKGRLTPLRLIEALTRAPAKLIGTKATLAPGQPADVTVIAPNLRWHAQPFVSRSQNSPFLGWEMCGRATLTMVGGNVVFHLDTE